MKYLLFILTNFYYRGVIDIDNSSYVLGEEEAIWLLKLILPYLNEFLLKLKALFSGDPATTMKVNSLFVFSVFLNFVLLPQENTKN